MPRFDGTGPGGMGPMTGRGMGNCGGGRRCRGCRGCFWGESIEDSTQHEELDALKIYKKKLVDEIELLEKKIKNG